MLTIRKHALPEKTTAHSLANSIILLAGIIVLATGYYGNIRIALITGIIIILAGVSLEATSVLTRQTARVKRIHTV